MKIVTVTFDSTNRRYSYKYNGSVDVEVGDIGIANNTKVDVVGVFDENSEAAINATKEIKYIFSLKAEREEAARTKRIAEIKSALRKVRRKQEERTELEAIAANNEEARILLAELDRLEK